MVSDVLRLRSRAEGNIEGTGGLDKSKIQCLISGSKEPQKEDSSVGRFG